MATFLCQVQTIQRGLGRSAVAAAAYRTGQALMDERLTMQFDAEVYAPADAPVRDRQTLWNAAEKSEPRKALVHDFVEQKLVGAE